jgi:tight adherence protein C
MLVAGLVVALAAVVGSLLYIGMQEDRGRDPLEDRLMAYGSREQPLESLEEAELSLSFRDRVIVPLAEWLANLTAKFTPQQQLEEARRMLELAGQNTDPTTFFLQRIGATVVFGLGTGFLTFVIMDVGSGMALLLTGAMTGLGYMFPLMSLRSKISKRQENVVRALPDALDLLVICVEAGLGFDAAMGKVYEKWDNELALAFGRVLREIQLGKVRRDALKDMADRLDVADVNTFTAAIIQAEQLGVSMAKILRVQSDQMRVKRRQRAQEKAQQAPVKMMIPMVLLIFPSLWIVLLGPAVIQLMNSSLF